MAIRDLTRYRWKKDFHKHIWELIKQQNPRLPRYNWEQFVASGWHIEVMTTFYGRNNVVIKHENGRSFSIPTVIDEHPQPHSVWLLELIIGYPTSRQGGITPAIRKEYHDYWLNNSIALKAMRNRAIFVDSNFTKLEIMTGPSWNWVLDEIFKDIYPTELDNNYVQPMATTAERFVRYIINMDRDIKLLL